MLYQAVMALREQRILGAADLSVAREDVRGL
jgi:hypothetical protein